MIKTQLTDANAKNPVVLRQVALRYNEGLDSRICLKLLTAENKELPYYLIQLYNGDNPQKFKLNFALHPNLEAFEQLQSGMLTSMDLIIGGLRNMEANGHQLFNVDNGPLYVAMLFNNQPFFESRMGKALDAVAIQWFQDNKDKLS